MTSISALIDFMMSLMRDEDTRMEFDRDPEGMLADQGLDGVTAQDVEDARLVMADDGVAQPRSGGYSSGTGGNDPVSAIRHTTSTYEIDQSRHVSADIDQRFNILTIDDRDTTVIDSFNSEDEVTAIQDNDTIEVVNIEDSFNEEPGESAEESSEEPTDEPTDEPTEPTDESVESGEEPADGPTEPLEGSVEEPEVFIEPVEAGPGDVRFGTEPELSIQPVEDPAELADAPDLDAEAAVG